MIKVKPTPERKLVTRRPDGSTEHYSSAIDTVFVRKDDIPPFRVRDLTEVEPGHYVFDRKAYQREYMRKRRAAAKKPKP